MTGPPHRAARRTEPPAARAPCGRLRVVPWVAPSVSCGSRPGSRRSFLNRASSGAPTRKVPRVSLGRRVDADQDDPASGNNSDAEATTVDNANGCTITGTTGHDTLNGTNAADVICGLGRNDTIDGKNGADTL
ncbi:hypothetical protein ABZ371_04710 [Streptomyces sp. NPDC005899]|uniref:hypothetical protein n=1 Tax=Streptomyces sp. NPDC005899 TaxID=3155716 RepID=UPI0033CCB3E4